MELVTVIAPLLPLRSGIAIYSHKLYTAISRKIALIVLSNRGSARLYSTPKMRVVDAWDPRSPPSLLRLLRLVVKTQSRVLHIQVPYTWIGGPTFTMLAIITTLVLARLRRMKVVITLHGVVTAPEVARRVRSKILRRLLLALLPAALRTFYRVLLFLSTVVIVHAPLVARFLARMSGVESPKNVIVIPHGVDRATHTRGRRKRVTTLLFIGFIRESKGLTTLLRAFTKLAQEFPNVRLVIAGSYHAGETADVIRRVRQELEERGLSDRVELICRFLSESELDRLIADADMIVLPYEDYFVEVSGVLARVMDYGKPVVCTRVPKFLSEVRHMHDGVLVRPGDSRELYEALLKLVRDEKLRRALGENMQKRAQRRYWEHVAASHVRLYLRVLRKHIM